MNKARLIEVIADKTSLEKKVVEKVIETMVDTIMDIMKAGEEVTLTGFGTFIARTREERWGVNPQNPSERIRIPTVIVPKFKAGKTLKDKLKSKGQE